MIIDEYLKGVPERLKQIEKALNMNKTKISEKAGMTRSAYSNIATGAQTPSYDFLQKICSTFNVSMDWIVYGEGRIFWEDNKFLSELDQDTIDLLKEINQFPMRIQVKFWKQVVQALETIHEAMNKEN